MSEDTIRIDGSQLTLEQLRRVAEERASVELAAKARQRVQRAAKDLQTLAASDRPIYGVNTGFGAFADINIGPDQAVELSRNLVLSHAAGVGPPFSEPTTRAAILIRANTLAAGHSGVGTALVDALLQMLNKRLTPCIPSRGSLGSSGDLAPLAHLSLMLAAGIDAQHLSTAQAWLNGELMSASDALRAAELASVTLGPKEGLALTNGASFSAALLCLATLRGQQMLLQAEIIAAMSYEALLGLSQALDDRLHRARRHPGQRHVATRMRILTKGSGLLNSGPQVQDPYSLRCIPQIHGPAQDLIGFVAQVVEREINAATDNPLLFGREALSGGNFHGEPLGLAADYLKLPLAEIGALSERRLFLLTTPNMNRGLPPMLVANPELAGIESGLMMLQYTSASLVLELKALASSDSIRSLPTSAGLEDLNANSTTAGRRLLELLENLATVLAIEWIAAAQAIELRLQADQARPLGRGSRIALDVLREQVPFNLHDRPLHPDIAAATEVLRSARLLAAIEAELGSLPDLPVPSS